ncbi:MULTISPECIES: ABC transporter substrate-binding protein [Marivita]|jgi:NitT/TauT family transport system substrate-binding protein|uniref:Thiamine pyrimidine synthase n=2 Tax=Marivita cryptomonadis TaxID=505252 RepID=A0A9Q2RYF5_9RHOB|nr:MULTISPECIES: ABC transporter substrate-binding protein [Marivita]MCR9168488.1 ABC transporter substrate-binding protein [Paracoccaceae bacterium]MBM2320093.1 ABC transporter substrate-binding protein [Marivita cryptomonadis]MBM2329672.1 ABC transporter substrate-binding protein [Marivita cryptomonadis]MBM2339260.1 ABC transporter substrate-binding protein [Marivita cryptomonadis]MBM2343918.1 ABC transporter substrate-binding protein [Marivita cryptomonadis]
MKHSLFGAALAMLAGAAPAFAEMTDIRFTLGWKTQGSDAPFLLALHKGYFEEEGLNVTIDQGEGSAATVTRIMGGAYDAGFGDINAIIQNAAARPGEAPVMVYQLWNRPPFAIVTPKTAGIESPADFEGKTLGGAQGTPTTRLFPVFAELNGIDLEKVAQENMAPNLQEPMMIRGDIDGAFVFTSTSWFNLIANRQDPANDYNWFNFEDYGMDLYSNGLMVSRAMLAENPEAVAGLVRAVNKATMEVAANQDSSVEAIMAFDNLVNPELERARLEFALTNLMNAPEVTEIGMGDLVDERLTRSIEIVAKGYGLDRLPEASEIFDRSFLPPMDTRTFEVTLN